MPNFTLIGATCRPAKRKIQKSAVITNNTGRAALRTKFTGFMHVVSLHKAAKFGCFTSIIIIIIIIITHAIALTLFIFSFNLTTSYRTPA